MEDAKKIKEDMQVMRKTFKAEYRERRDLLKQTMRAEKLRIKQQTPHTLNLLDRTLLQICLPFESLAIQLRYKATDPEGYQADRVIRDSEGLIEHYEKKGGALRDKDLALLGTVQVALSTLKVNQVKQHRVNELSERIMKLTPQVGMEEINNMFEQLTKMLTV